MCFLQKFAANFLLFSLFAAKTLEMTISTRAHSKRWSKYTTHVTEFPSPTGLYSIYVSPQKAEFSLAYLTTIVVLTIQNVWAILFKKHFHTHAIFYLLKTLFASKSVSLSNKNLMFQLIQWRFGAAEERHSVDANY